MTAACCQNLVRGLGLGQGILRVVAEEGVDPGIHPFDPIDAGLHRFAGRNLALDQPSRQLRNS